VEFHRREEKRFIGNSQRPMNLDYDSDIFEKLLRYLVACRVYKPST